MRAIGVRIWAAVVFVAFVSASAGAPALGGELDSLEIVTAAGRHVFQVEIANNDATREHGLMDRRYMAPDHGMLFEFDREAPVSFWMKNTYIPLDMIFIAPSGVVTHIAANADALCNLLHWARTGEERRMYASAQARDEGIAAGALLPAAELRARFERSQWADRWPQAVEVPFETLVGDRLVRGRIDAVFADAPEGGYDVVDWKTGRPPASDAERHAVSVQLAAYRLAWATLTGVPVTQVRAAFHYVADDVTVRPADLLDESGLTALINHIPAEVP